MKKLLMSTAAAAGILVFGSAVHAQSVVNLYENYYSPNSQTGGSCSRDTNGNWTCVGAPNGNVAWSSFSEAQGASFYNFGTQTYVSWDGNTYYFVVAR
jgi:hypothetical protein